MTSLLILIQLKNINTIQRMAVLGALEGNIYLPRQTIMDAICFGLRSLPIIASVTTTLVNNFVFFVSVKPYKSRKSQKDHSWSIKELTTLGKPISARLSVESNDILVR